jgi:RHS repeat-associated protein
MPQDDENRRGPKTPGALGSQGATPEKGSGSTEARSEQSTQGQSGDGGQKEAAASPGSVASLLPAISAPTGGGAIRGIGEKFEVNAVTGTAGLTIPLPSSPGRGGQGPQISLNYSSGGGNGPFGLGFDLSVPMITRKTDKGLPRYLDQPSHETDTFLLSGAEDLVPVLNESTGDHQYIERYVGTPTPAEPDYRGYLYRPRIEGLFARIERIVPLVGGQPDVSGEVFWRVHTPDNAVHIYGQSAACRVADPTDATKVFTWYLQETTDDKGNVTLYEYKAENEEGLDPTQLRERSRFDYSSDPPLFLATAQKYLKRVFYGNRVPGAGAVRADFLFELVFDYGEHTASSDTTAPLPDDGGEWGVRSDPFSSYRSGFEIRTYRLCQRVLMFHHIEAGGPVFVRATEFEYEPGEAFTYLRHVTQAGFKLEGGIWERGEMPKLSLDYQRPEIHDELLALDEDSLEGLTGGADGSRKQWIDLDGEGIPGVLIDQGGAWFYKENRGAGELKAPRRLSTLPSPSALAGGAQTLEDIDGDGRLEVVSRRANLQGYFARTAEGDFEPLRAFESVPNVNWNDPNLRIIDLDGDGHGDILMTEDQAFVWYRSRAKKGFEQSKRVPVSFDENQGPRVVFSDAEQSIQLADMSGDGLIDIVRIRNGEVSYWPNLGYGRFGKKITLENSPLFTTPDEFHASRVRFGDIDGSGTSDLFYLGRRETTLYFNQSGNALGAGTVIRSLPPVDKVTQASVADLLGTGTSCLVWSSPVANPSQNVLYVDLMGSKKPHLLVEVSNNLGATTRTTYGTSTAEYLRDKKNGDIWLTRLPFPVQVVKRVEREDAISGGTFVSEYQYRHGFFDGFEREFRGFARVETTDAEDFASEGGDPLLYQRPVRTVSWFHTGAWLEKERLEEALRKEYFPFELGGDPIVVEDSPRLEEKDPNAAQESYIPAAEVSIQDAREAARALKGAPLRQEIYALDAEENPDLADKPYVITEQNQQVRRLQKSRGEDRYGVFFAYARESVTVSSERNLSDPRVGHEIVLDVDEFGVPKRSASLVYGRASGEPEQQKSYVTLSESDCVHQVEEPTASVPTRPYRIGTQIESRAYEVTGLSSSSALTPPFPTAGSGLVAVGELRAALDDAGVSDVDFDHDLVQNPVPGVVRRLLDRSRQTFYNDGLTAEAAHGTVGTRALPYKTYQLALTTGNVALLVSESNGLAGAANQFDPTLLTGEGKYEDVEGNGEYWAVSGRAEFDASNFYLPVKAIDPWGGESTVTWDAFGLMPVAATDPVGNIVQSTNDYRVLAPRLVTDPNLNRSEVEFDALGMVVATAVMGKVGSSDGDVITDPTTTLEYDLLAFQDRGEPAFVKTRAKETHGPTDSETKFQESYAYSDGFGRVIQQKVQAESGEAPRQNADGTAVRDPGTGEIIYDADVPRWVGTGRTIFNNKGNPVKQYEPYFSSVPAFDSEIDLVEWGVTPIITYDSIDRVVRTDLPDGTFTKVEFDSWEQLTFDQNDTCRHPTDPSQHSAWYVERGAPAPTAAEPTDPNTRAAWLSAQHANTPTRVLLDSLGRPFLTIAHNRVGTGASAVDEFYRTRTVLDVEGNILAVYDAKQHSKAAGSHALNGSGTYATVAKDVDVLGGTLRVVSADSGRRLTVLDVGGKALRSYNSRGYVSRAEFDAAQRVTHTWVKQFADAEVLVGRVSYGEELDVAPSIDPANPSPAQLLNLRGQTYIAWDTAGQVKTEEVDFKDNVLRASRKLALEYQATPDWSTPLGASSSPAILEANAVASLEAETFTTQTSFDAMNRVIQTISPDGSVATPTYNEANLLEESTVNVKGGAATRVVFDLDYNARAQRVAVSHADDGNGNGSHSIAYTYDEKTFRITRVRATRTSDGSLLQSLDYYYDAIGNITSITDGANWNPVLQTAAGGGHAHYRYDSLSRLVEARGREHPSQNPIDKDANEPPKPHTNDLTALTTYVEETTYDEVGNIVSMRHLPSGGGTPAWERRYQYATDSNRLLGTSVPNDPLGTYSARYGYEEDLAVDGNNGGAHGSMTSMPHLAQMHWDYDDRLKRTVKSNGSNQYAWFAYDGSGERVRKVYEHSGITEERIYLGGFEIYRKRSGAATPVLNAAIEVERETLHVMDGASRIAMVETLTADVPGNEPINIGESRWRYQLDNHLGSSGLELDFAANVISYEEYHPYGSTAFRMSQSSEVSAKRYRYIGKEKDEETGLYYAGSRYYAAWLGRWTAADPTGLSDGPNIYQYSRNNPINFYDPSGNWGIPSLDDIKSFGTGLKERTVEKVGNLANGVVAAAEGVGNYVEKTGNALGDIAYGEIHGDNDAKIRGAEALIESLETISIQNQVKVAKAVAKDVKDTAVGIKTEAENVGEALGRGDFEAAGRHTADLGGNIIETGLAVLPAAKGVQALKTARAAKVAKATEATAKTAKASKAAKVVQAEKAAGTAKAAEATKATKAADAAKTAKSAEGTRAANSTGPKAGEAKKSDLSSLSDEQFVQEVANRVEKAAVRKGIGPAGTGPTQGTLKHTSAERLVKRYQRLTGQRTHLEIEESYLSGQRVPRGTKGSARPDVYDPTTGNVYDYKFVGTPGRGLSRAQQLKNQNNLPYVNRQVEINPN